MMRHDVVALSRRSEVVAPCRPRLTRDSPTSWLTFRFETCATTVETSSTERLQESES